jgi:hypothetical protein
MLRQNSNAPRAKWSMVLHDLRFKPTMYASRLGESQASLVPQEEHAQLKMPLTDLHENYPDESTNDLAEMLSALPSRLVG